ncbi:MAG: hypothetical protein ABIW94_09990 [Gemmatimonadaceae bacterium]
MMRPFLRFCYLLVAVAGIAFPSRVAGQAMLSDSGARESFTHGVILVNGDSVDRLRLAQLEGRVPLEDLMLRSTSSLMNPRASVRRPRAFTIVFPTLTFVSNSTLPFGQNDGALWAGKGANQRALAGFTASLGPVRLVIIPELAYSSNNRINIDPADPRFVKPVPAERSTFSSPSNVFPYSIDMPYRFGGDPITKIYPGQSSLNIRAGPVEVGAATENNWWGPALINPLVLGDNAAGFPHAFLRTSHPLNTILGLLEARWIVGGLKESDFFDNNPDNDVRSLSAIGIAWKRDAGSGLTLGFLRSVFSVAIGYGEVPGHTFDALKNTGHPNALAISDSTMIPGSDQIFSLFARWALPRYGLESYVEWGRTEFPVSLRDFLKQPEHSRGYTTGLQWSRPIGTDARFRVQGEVTNVEQSSSFRFRPIGSFYTSRSVIQGYTNEGQVIGAGIGPGSSAQWIAGDYFKRGWQVGVTAGRLRFNNDAFFLRSYANRCGHDVTTYPGVRAAYANSYFRLRADFASASRYNTFFQNVQSCQSSDGEGSDRSNKYLSVTLATFGW